MKQLIRSSRGDTIVEVLIAMAVVSLVLGGAYVSAHRSSQAVRTAQERGEALKYAESQLEQLKAANPKPTGSFCFELDGSGPSHNPPPCKPASGIQYEVTDNLTSGNYQVIVQWDAINGGPKNNLELDYSTQ